MSPGQNENSDSLRAGLFGMLFWTVECLLCFIWPILNVCKSAMNGWN